MNLITFDTPADGQWAAKYVTKGRQRDLRVPRIELRRRIRECDVLICVQWEGGYDYCSPTYRYISSHQCRVKLTLNGPLWLEPSDLQDIQDAISEAHAWLNDRYATGLL